MLKLAEMYDNAASSEEYTRKYCAHMADILANIDTAAMAKIIETFDKAAQENRAIFFMANGGSAAMAAHWVNDLVAGGYVEGEYNFRAFSLTDNIASVTAIGNDSGFDNLFKLQLAVDMRPGDVVFAMSVSGNSENLIRGIDYANANGATTIGVSGFDGGRLKERCAISMHIPSTEDEYGPVEDMFSIIDHIVTSYLTMKRGKRLKH